MKTCQNCGKQLKPRKREWWEYGNGYGDVMPRKWCSLECRDRWYAQAGYWWAASAVVWRRAERSCEKCGAKGGLEVHHIIPLNGAVRTQNELNLPSNLVLVCHDCHQKAHGNRPITDRYLHGQLESIWQEHKRTEEARQWQLFLAESSSELKGLMQ